MDLVVTIIINYVVLLIVLVVIGIERLIDHDEGLLRLIFIIILSILVLNNIDRPLDVNYIILFSILPRHLTACSVTSIKQNQRSIEIV